MSLFTVEINIYFNYASHFSEFRPYDYFVLHCNIGFILVTLCKIKPIFHNDTRMIFPIYFNYIPMSITLKCLIRLVYVQALSIYYMTLCVSLNILLKKNRCDTFPADFYLYITKFNSYNIYSHIMNELPFCTKVSHFYCIVLYGLFYNLSNKLIGHLPYGIVS